MATCRNPVTARRSLTPDRSKQPSPRSVAVVTDWQMPSPPCVVGVKGVVSLLGATPGGDITDLQTAPGVMRSSSNHLTAALLDRHRRA